MTPRYTIQLHSRRINGARYVVAEIWRMSDHVKIHEEWERPIGVGLEEASRIQRLLEVAPDEFAETIVQTILWDRLRAEIGDLPALKERAIGERG